MVAAAAEAVAVEADLGGLPGPGFLFLTPLPLGLPRGRPVGWGLGLRLEGERGGRPRLRLGGWSVVGGGVEGAAAVEAAWSDMVAVFL